MLRPIQNWLDRHTNRTNFWLHMLGIPACFIVAPVLLAFQQVLLAGAAFVAGYALQFAGHFIEGNRSGEELLVRRILRRL